MRSPRLVPGDCTKHLIHYRQPNSFRICGTRYSTKSKRVAAVNPEDAKDLQETLDELSQVDKVLRDLKIGDILEPAARTIEDRYAITLRRAEAERGLPRVREQAKKELSDLRVIRDELYYSLLFPNWARTRNEAMRKTLKRGA